jgi:hypothetical protein
MKPRISILDDAVACGPSYATSITEAWWHFGWRPPRRDEQKSQPRPRALSQALENAMAQAACVNPMN